MKQTPKFVTKLFAAIDGYAEIKAHSERQALNLSRAARDTIKPIIEQHNGVWMYEKNGEIFANFKLPEDAVKCAVALQREMSDNPDVKLRIGIHTGDIKSGIGTGDIVASKIAGSASLRGICISGKVYASIQNKTDVSAEYIEDVKPEGVEHPVSVYSLTVPGIVEPAVASDNSKTRKQSTKPSIAVLPFVNMSADPEQEYFCDGMAEEIINALTHVEDLYVVARTSAFSFRGKEIDVRKIGEQLGVGAVLEGSVRKAGNRIRITAQLVDVVNGYHLWSERYDRELEDVFAIQDEISFAIVEALKVKLLKKEKEAIVKRYTEDRDAYTLYLKGRYFWNRRHEYGLIKGREYFQMAIDKDPHYALAYVGIADTLSIAGTFGFMPPKKAFPEARTALEKALALDTTLAEAHSSFAWLQCAYEWDWTAAGKRFQHALTLNTKYPYTHEWYAIYLAARGNIEEAITEIEIAQNLDPLAPIFSGLSIWFYFTAGRYDEAIEKFYRTIDINPDFGQAYMWAGQVYTAMGDYDKAVDLLTKALERMGETSWAKGMLGYVYGLSGDKDKALQILHDLKEYSESKFVPPYNMVLCYLGMGDIDNVFKWLDRAIAERDFQMILLKVAIEYNSVRQDARFQDLLGKMKLIDNLH